LTILTGISWQIGTTGIDFLRHIGSLASKVCRAGTPLPDPETLWYLSPCTKNVIASAARQSSAASTDDGGKTHWIAALRSQ
jgi:hypothetical protein